VRSRIVRVHAAAIFPLLAGYACLAPTLIPWLLGSRWTPVVTPSQYMTVSGAVTTVLTGTGALMAALGRPDLTLAWNFGHFVCFGAVVYLVAPQGIVTVAAVVAGFYLLQGLAAHWFLLRRNAGIPMRDLFNELLGPCAGCAALAACAAPLRWLLSDAGAPPPLTLVVAGATGSVAYLLVMRMLFPAVWADLRLLTQRLLRRERAPELAASTRDEAAHQPVGVAAGGGRPGSNQAG
jgi:O-antigen/teichoic acid export membrane protein